MCAGFITVQEFQMLMDQVCQEKELEGSTPRDPKKEVTIMVIKEHRNSPDPAKKFAWWKPVATSMLPKFKLLHPDYWKKQDSQSGEFGGGVNNGKKKITLMHTMGIINNVNRKFAQR